MIGPSIMDGNGCKLMLDKLQRTGGGPDPFSYFAQAQQLIPAADMLS
jgi:hypothetical protein